MIDLSVKIPKASDKKYKSTREGIMKHPDYDYDEIADKIFLPIYDRIADQIIEKCKITAGRMLDIGCGGGHLGFAVMNKTTLEGHFADIQPAALEIAEIRAAERGLSDRSCFYQTDVHDMDIPDNFADLIVSRGSYLFWKDQIKAFQEIWRVLTPGGRTYIGSGLGSPEQRKEIHRKMDEIYGCWQSPHSRPNESLSTEEYHKLFKGLGWDYEIIDDDEGRWFIIKKEKQ